MDIRDERRGDADAVFEVHRLAFGRDQEGRIVNALREHDASILSLVAVENEASWATSCSARRVRDPMSARRWRPWRWFPLCSDGASAAGS